MNPDDVVPMIANELIDPLKYFLLVVAHPRWVGMSVISGDDLSAMKDMEMFGDR